MKLPLTAVVGELIGEIQTGLVEDVHRRVRGAGFVDVRPSHDCVFGHLSPEGTRLRDIAASARMTPQAVGEHVDELERLGYVERAPDPVDRRAKLIRPTARGVAFMEASLNALREIEREWNDAVGARRLAQMSKALQEIRGLRAAD